MRRARAPQNDMEDMGIAKNAREEKLAAQAEAQDARGSSQGSWHREMAATRSMSQEQLTLKIQSRRTEEEGIEPAVVSAQNPSGLHC